MSEKKIDHVRVINKLKEKGFNLPPEQKITTRSPSGGTIQAWKREDIIMFPEEKRDFLSMGQIGYSINYNVLKNTIMTITPMLYLGEPFEVTVLADRKEGVVISNKFTDIDTHIKESIANPEKYLDAFEEKLKFLNSRVLLESELVAIGKDILLHRFNPKNTSYHFELAFGRDQTDPLQVFKVSEEVASLIRRDRVMTALDAYVVAFINLLSDQSIDLIGVGLRKGAKKASTLKIRSNLGSSFRRYNFSFNLAEVFEEHFYVIKEVRVFKF